MTSNTTTPSLETYIRSRLQRKKLLLMAHVMVGYPSLDANMEMLEILNKADVDIVELQWPFSEPIADGPIFTQANQAALDAGIDRQQYLQLMRRAYDAFDFKILEMGYYNSIFQVGHANFCESIANQGGSGFIVADLPPQEAHSLFTAAQENHLAPIVLMTPTNSVERLNILAGHAQGFVYCVARKGVTGASTSIDQSLESFIARCRDATLLPLALGFGMKSAQDLEQIRDLVDIGVVGTALLQAWQDGGREGYSDFVKDLMSVCV